MGRLGRAMGYRTREGRWRFRRRPSFERALSLLSFYDDFDRSRHARTELCGHAVLAQLLDRRIQIEVFAIEVDTLLVQRIGDVARGHRAEQLVALAGLRRDLDGDAADLSGQAFRDTLLL